MRHLGIVWGPGYPREQVWALPPPQKFDPVDQMGYLGGSFQEAAQLPGVIQLAHFPLSKV